MTAAPWVCFSPGGAATDVRFLPEVELRALRNGNVAIVGDQAISDEVVQLRLRLNLEGQGNTYRYRLSYAPSHEFFNEFSNLDNTSHAISVGFSRDTARHSTFALALDASRSEQQGLQGLRPDIPTTLVPRTTADFATLSLGGQIEAGHRSRISWGATGAVRRYEDRPGTAFEDSDSASGTFGWSYQVARRATVGLTYRFQRISFEVRDTTRAHSLQLQASHQFGKSLRGKLLLGAVHSRVGDLSSTDPSLDATLRRALGEQTSLVVGLRQGVSSGTGLSGPTLDRGAYVSWRNGGRGHVQANVTLGYAQRNALQETAGTPRPTTRTITTSESIGWSIGQKYALGVFHGYADQSAAAGSDPRLSTRYHSGGFFFRWSPMAQ